MEEIGTNNIKNIYIQILEGRDWIRSKVSFDLFIV